MGDPRRLGMTRTAIAMLAFEYDAMQREAEHAGRGIWTGSYVEPWLYRVCVRAGGRPGVFGRCERACPRNREQLCIGASEVKLRLSALRLLRLLFLHSLLGGLF